MCTDCDKAKAGMWCGYSAGCTECQARSVARCLDAFNALHPKGTGDRDGLRMVIERVMTTVPYPDARRAVWRWWLIDHPDAKAHSA